MDQREIQEERSSSFTKTTKSVRRVQQSSVESVESSGSLGDFSTGQGSPSSVRKETRTTSQIQKMFNSSGEFQFEPLLSLGSRFTGKDSDFEDVSTQLCCSQEQEKFEMKLDVTEYSPDDIQVKVLDDMVVITGKQEIRISENNFRSRSFSKKFSIPPGVTPEKIKCSLSKSGILTISAPLEKEEHRRQVTQTQSTTSVTSNMSNLTDSSQGRNSPILVPRKVNSSPKDKELGTFVDSKTFTVRVEVKRFEASEIKVKISKSLITVEGKHESEFASRSFYKEFTLVRGVRTDKMECTMSTDGILTITAPIEDVPNQGLEEVEERTHVSQTQQSKVVQQKQEVRQHQERVTQEEVTQQHQEVTKQKQEVKQQQQEVTQQKQEVKQQQQEVTQQKQEVKQQQQEVTQQKQEVTQQKQEVAQQKQEVTQKEVTQQKVTQQHISQQEISQEKPLPIETQKVAPQGGKAPEPKGKSPPPKGQSPHRATPPPKSKSPPKFPLEEGAEAVPISTLPNAEPRVTSPSTDEGPNEICQTNDGKTLKIRVNVTEYTREELRVKIVKRMIVIEGTHEDELSSRSFLKKVPIPPGVEPNQITSALAPNGVLVVTAPVTPCQDSSHPTKDVTETSTKTHQQVETQRRTVTTERNEEIEEDDFVMVPSREDSSPPPTSPDDEDDMPKEISNVLNDDKYEMVLDVSKYKKEEIEVKVSKTTIRIEGKQTRQFSSRSFFKETPIPDGVKPEDVKTTLTPNGHLTISAPVEKKSQPAPTQVVPKEMTHKITQDFSKVDVKEVEKKTETQLQKSNSDDQVNKVTEVNDGKTFKVTVDVKEFRREEITIRVTRNVIRIEGKRQIDAKETSRTAATKTFFKEVPLPAGVEPSSITSSVSPQGVLTITAPVTTTTEHKTVKKDLSSQTRQTNLQQQTTETQQRQQNVSETQQTQQTIQQQKETQQQQHLRQQENRETVDRNSSCTQKTSTQEVTYLKSTLDLNAAKETIDGAVRDIDPNEKTFEMVYNIAGYKAEDLTIRITKYVVTVTGKQCTEFSSRSFTKKFSIPQGVDPRDFKPTLTAQGILTFSAPIDNSHLKATA